MLQRKHKKVDSSFILPPWRPSLIWSHSPDKYQFAQTLAHVSQSDLSTVIPSLRANVKPLWSRCRNNASQAKLKRILIDQRRRRRGARFTHIMIGRPINPFIWLTFQLLILCISSGLRTSNHLCDGDDGDRDVWAADNSYNTHCLQTNSHYRSFSTKSSGGPLVHELQRANVMWSLCEACQDWGGWNSVDWRPPEIVASCEVALLKQDRNTLLFILQKFMDQIKTLSY